eukprot:TRINITY_DN34011_c0_g1_i1.p1 TRINITY_DN34011_c0_g1~~TRINITY_DN34011_c0_g1_i1.p1  ORF type:complete len:1065 (-),score=192.82 TRINITY_DN34011_c0_g1_i1:213-3407(-)
MAATQPAASSDDAAAGGGVASRISVDKPYHHTDNQSIENVDGADRTPPPSPTIDEIDLEIVVADGTAAAASGGATAQATAVAPGDGGAPAASGQQAAAAANAKPATATVSSHDEAAKEYLSLKAQGTDIDASTMGQLKRFLAPDEFDILNLINGWDDNHDGNFSITEVVQVAKYFKEQQTQIKSLKKTVFYLILLTVVLGLFLFGICVGAVFVLKDSFVRDDGLMRTGNGSPVMVASSDTYIDEDGLLVQRTSAQVCDGATARRLQESNGTASTGPKTIATAQAKLPKKLSSSLGDSFFKQLKEVMFTGTSGATVYTLIDGFIRVPDPGAQCGSFVYLLTSKGHIMLDSTDVSFEEGAWKEIMGHNFEFAIGGLGRRLVSAEAPTGFFNALSDAADDWGCSEVPPPKLPTAWSATWTQYKSCERQKDVGTDADTTAFISPCQSDYGGWKPGVLPQLPSDILKARGAATGLVSEMFQGSEEMLEEAIGEDAVSHVRVTVGQTVRTQGYALSVESDFIHPGQHKMELVRNSDVLSRRFQAFLAGSQGGKRMWCEDISSAERRARRLSKAEQRRLQGEEPKMEDDYFLEYKGIWIENGTSYRHWRLHHKYDEAAEAEESDESDGSDESGEDGRMKFIEYWDVAATLLPYRIAFPSGQVTVYHDAKLANDDDIQVALGRYNLTIDDVFKGDCNIEVASASSEGSPQMGNKDLLRQEAFYYMNYEGISPFDLFSDDIMMVALDPLDTASQVDDYMNRVMLPFALSEVCASRCGVPREFSEREEVDTQSCLAAQSHLQCLLDQPFVACRQSNLVTTAVDCDPNDFDNATIEEVDSDTEVRRLLTARGEEDIDDLEEQEDGKASVERRLQQGRRLAKSRRRRCKTMKFRLGSAKLNAKLYCGDNLIDLTARGSYSVMGCGVSMKGSLKVTKSGEASGSASIAMKGKIFWVITVSGSITFAGTSNTVCEDTDFLGYVPTWKSDCSRRRSGWWRRRRASGCYQNKAVYAKECSMQPSMTITGSISASAIVVRASATASYASSTGVLTVSAKSDAYGFWGWSNVHSDVVLVTSL